MSGYSLLQHPFLQALSRSASAGSAADMPPAPLLCNTRGNTRLEGYSLLRHTPLQALSSQHQARPDGANRSGQHCSASGSPCVAPPHALYTDSVPCSPALQQERNPFCCSGTMQSQQYLWS